MRLEDVATMIGSWPIRFFKNHGTANMQRPASGFLVDERWKVGEAVPVEAVEIAMAEQRTLVMHNLEVYWPPIGKLIWHLARYMHAYTQVNLYISPPLLSVATAAHQDAHSVFIVQTHGAKRWCVHAPRAPMTLKGLQRGKGGEVLHPSDRSVMGPPLLNVTMRPGMALFIPRGHFHHTATEPAMLAADDVVDGVAMRLGGAGGGNDGGAAEDGDWTREGQPSMALTLSMLSEDVFCTWLHLLGEALQALPAEAAPPAEVARLVASLRRVAARTVGEEEDVGSRLREALPRTLAQGCELSDKPSFTATRAAGWRRYAIGLLLDALRADGPSAAPRWLDAHAPPDAPVFAALDGVLRRKRIPCDQKRAQIEAMQAALAGRLPLSGEPLAEIDVDAIFKIEKRDKSYLPADREWFRVRQWS